MSRNTIEGVAPQLADALIRDRGLAIKTVARRVPAAPVGEVFLAMYARVVDLMTFTGLVGAASIWPAKIGVLYALFLCLALFAFSRLDRRLLPIPQNFA